MKLLDLTAGLLTCFGCAAPAVAQVTISVDMDTTTPGIQSTRTALGPFTAALVMTVGPGGVSSCGISELFDNTELSLVGAPASTELLPAGFTFNLTPGVTSESQALGQVYTFETATLGLGPANTNFTIGTINFTAAALVDDGVPDITLGFYNLGLDGLFDNSGNPVVPVFANGFLAPKPLLRVALTSTNTVLIAWPNPSTGFSLLQNADLGTANWVSVTNAVNVVGSEKQVIIAPPIGQKFYRLANP